MKNPIIQKARKEAYELGYKNGAEMGHKIALQQAEEFFKSKFDGLDKVPGIGPKIFEKFMNHFGNEYFVKVGDTSEENKANHQ
jgi:excinuclease UvrABC nuclease subunit